MSSSSGRIARSTGILAAAISLSRVLGFVRDLLLAGLFGTTAQAQAFVVAFRLPNLLRDLVAEGAVTSAFVPVLSWYRAKGKPGEFWQLSQALFCRLLVLLSALGLAGSLAAPWIVRLIAPGFAGEPEKFALTVRLTRLLFPFITLVGLWAYFMGLLNSLGRFAMPALGPAILNFSMIIACVWFVPTVEPGIVAVTIGVMIGGVIQLLIQIPAAFRMGFRWAWRWRHPGSKDILQLLGPRMVGSAVYQVSVLVDTALASLSFVVGPGAVAALYYANRLVQLPLAVFGTASAQASLPSLSEQAAHGDLNAFHSTLLSVVRMVGFVVIPSAVGLMVLAFPIVGGLFERGAFDRQATVMTAQALICYAPGLLAFSLSKSLTGAFYALRETRAPVKLAIHAMVLNAALSLALMWPLRIMGLALAASITNTINGYRLLRLMEARLGRPILEPVSASLARMTGAAAVMGAGCWFLWSMTVTALPAWLGLLVVIPCGGAVYLTACKLFGVRELTSVFRWIKQLPSSQPSVSD